MQLTPKSPAAIHSPIRRSPHKGWRATEEPPAASVPKKLWCKLRTPVLWGSSSSSGCKGQGSHKRDVRELHHLIQYPKALPLGAHSGHGVSLAWSQDGFNWDIYYDQLAMGSLLPPAFLLEFPWQLWGKWATFVGWDFNGTPSNLTLSLSSAVSRPSWARRYVQTPRRNGSRTP